MSYDGGPFTAEAVKEAFGNHGFKLNDSSFSEASAEDLERLTTVEYANKIIDAWLMDQMDDDGEIMCANFKSTDYETAKELYPNLRTEAYAELARDIRNGFYIPEDVRAELLAQQVTIDNRGRIALVPKELVKKQLGRSPDRADAIALANYARNHGGATVGQGYSAQGAKEVGDRYLSLFSAYNS